MNVTALLWRCNCRPMEDHASHYLQWPEKFSRHLQCVDCTRSCLHTSRYQYTYTKPADWTINNQYGEGP